MKRPIKEIASLKSGFYSKPADAGDIPYIQARHFDEGGNFDTTVKSFLNAESNTEKELLADKDILFAAKGSRNFAVVYDHSNGPAIASTSFFIMRIRPEYQESIIPEYVAWFINHPQTQRRLKPDTRGTFIPSITMKAFDRLEIEIPDLEAQRLILRIDELRKQERQLHAELDTMRERLIQIQLMSSIHN